jgi:hypothetical protein
VTFPSLKAGDSFTLDDMGHPEGSEDGTKVYKALSDPTFKDGVWGIQTDV